jgi:hypothetical protein
MTFVRKHKNLMPVLLQPSLNLELFTAWTEGEARQVAQIMVHNYLSSPWGIVMLDRQVANKIPGCHNRGEVFWLISLELT